MPHQFKPCVSRTACTEDGERCRACGRTHEEINSIQTITNQVTEFVQKMDYENSDEFLEYLSEKVAKKLKMAKKPSM